MEFKKVIKLKFLNGLNLTSFKREVFDINKISECYNFIESDEPDFIIFGPYGNTLPPKGKYTRIAYLCENVNPNLDTCEWAFGVPREEEINNKRYKRIQWHGFNPQSLIKDENCKGTDILASKTKFCNFIYSHRVPYRESFFLKLSKYKKIDSPAKSMNNMVSFDNNYKGDMWERKRQFQSQYKFTLALENYVFPGYQTEKLYDSMLSNSLPIYIGDPYIGDVFNVDSLVMISNRDEYETNFWLKRIEDFAQWDIADMTNPTFYKDPYNRIKRKSKNILKDFKMKFLMKKFDESLIDLIIDIDRDDEKYLAKINAPWLKFNSVDESTYSKLFWQNIFDSK